MIAGWASFRPPASALTTVRSNAVVRRSSSRRMPLTVERELEVGAAGRCVVDGDYEVLLQLRAGWNRTLLYRRKKRGLPKRSSEAASSRAGPSRYSS